MDLLVGIIGWGDIKYENAARLLDDYLPREPDIRVGVELPEKQPGVGQVMNWMDTVHQEYRKTSAADVMYEVQRHQGDSVLIVVSTDYLGVEIRDALEHEVPVLDLTRALFPVTSTSPEMPPDEAVLAAETAPGKLATETNPPALEAVRNALRDGGYNTELISKVEEIMTEYHARAYIDGVPWETPREEIKPVAEMAADKTELYYHDEAKGTYRKKGRRKIKPGEKEITLTAQQEEELADKIS